MRKTIAPNLRKSLRRSAGVRTNKAPKTIFDGFRGKVEYHADQCEPTTGEWSDLR